MRHLGIPISLLIVVFIQGSAYETKYRGQDKV